MAKKDPNAENARMYLTWIERDALSYVEKAKKAVENMELTINALADEATYNFEPIIPWTGGEGFSTKVSLGDNEKRRAMMNEVADQNAAIHLRNNERLTAFLSMVQKYIRRDTVQIYPTKRSSKTVQIRVMDILKDACAPPRGITPLDVDRWWKHYQAELERIKKKEAEEERQRKLKADEEKRRSYRAAKLAVYAQQLGLQNPELATSYDIRMALLKKHTLLALADEMVEIRNDFRRDRSLLYDLLAIVEATPTIEYRDALVDDVRNAARQDDGRAMRDCNYNYSWIISRVAEDFPDDIKIYEFVSESDDYTYFWRGNEDDDD